MIYRRLIWIVTVALLTFSGGLELPAQGMKIRIDGRPDPTDPKTAKADYASEQGLVAEVAPTPKEHSEIADLIEQLGSGRLAQRERAMGELASYKGRALGQVLAAKNHDHDEIAMRAAQLENVIKLDQGPLFLAARRLSLSISELKLRLSTNDLSPLLGMLRNSAEAGMVPLWTLIFQRLANRNQVFTAAEICLQVEGQNGYSQALARAATSSELAGGAHSLALLSILMPPSNAADSIDTIAGIYALRGKASGPTAKRYASSLRGLFQARDIFSALPVQRVPHKADADEYRDMRQSIAFTMLKTCDQEGLKDSHIPCISSMSSVVLESWLGLLVRSGLTSEVESTLLSLIASGANNSRINSAAGAWANMGKQADIIELFPELPISSRLAIVDIWLAHPRNPAATQAFAINLLDSDQPWARVAAIKLLGQLQSSGTIAALVASIVAFPDTAHVAISALANMAEDLSIDQLAKLQSLLDSANALTRPELVKVIFHSNNQSAHAALMSHWKKRLPFGELTIAVLLFARDTSTPVGAFAAACMPNTNLDSTDELTYLQLNLGAQKHIVLRDLINMNANDGFSLLQKLATDETAPQRHFSALSLALAGRDSELIADWIKQLTGEIPSPSPSRFTGAIAASRQPEAEAFRKSILEEGISSKHFLLLFWSVINGNTAVLNVQKLREIVFASKEEVSYYGQIIIQHYGQITKSEAEQYASSMMFSYDTKLFLDSWKVHVVHQSGADIISVLFGTNENPAPADANQVLAVALLGNTERAREIIADIKPDKSGKDYLTLQIAKAWLGLLNKPEADRLLYVFGHDAKQPLGQLRLMQRSSNGDVAALRKLLDIHHPHTSVLADNSSTVSLKFDDDRWGDVTTVISPALAKALQSRSSAPIVHLSVLAKNIDKAPASNWTRWWQANRGRVQWDVISNKFILAELP